MLATNPSYRPAAGRPVFLGPGDNQDGRQVGTSVTAVLLI